MNTPTQVDTVYSLVDLINLAIAGAIFIAIALCVYYIFVGGISFILSGGKEDKIKEAINTIRYAVIGLIVTILSVVMISIMGNIFGVNVNEKINPEAMMEMSKKIYDRIVNGPNTTSG